MAQIHFLIEFRERTGMTQNALAALLHVNRSHVNMNERGERILPAEATLRIVQLVQQMDDAVHVAESALPTPTSGAKEKLKQILLQHAASKRYAARRLEKKIQAHEKQEAQRGQMRVLLAALKKLHSQQTPAEHEAKWLAFHESLGGYYYNYKDWEVEADRFNRVRLAALLHEAEEAERMAVEITTDGDD